MSCPFTEASVENDNELAFTTFLEIAEPAAYRFGYRGGITSFGFVKITFGISAIVCCIVTCVVDKIPLNSTTSRRLRRGVNNFVIETRCAFVF